MKLADLLSLGAMLSGSRQPVQAARPEPRMVPVSRPAEAGSWAPAPGRISGALLVPAGSYRVIDGDTIAVYSGSYRLKDGSVWEASETFRVRFRSVGASELRREMTKDPAPPRDIWKNAWEEEMKARMPDSQGVAARRAVEILLSGRDLEVLPWGADHYGRLLADIHAAPGFSVELCLFETGLVSIMDGQMLPEHRAPPPQIDLRAALGLPAAIHDRPKWLSAFIPVQSPDVQEHPEFLDDPFPLPPAVHERPSFPGEP